MKRQFSAMLGAVYLSAAALVATPALAQVDPTLPDLVPMGIGNFLVSTNPFRCGGTSALEFDILTANIGGMDWTRPQTPDGTAFRMPQIYEYTMYNYQQVGTDEEGNPIFDWVQVDRRRKNTICTIDDGGRGNVYPCIQAHGPTHTCSPFPRQGVSRGWADSYFRGLTGQFSCIMGFTGNFKLNAHLDPDQTVVDDGILPPESIDATHDNNYADLYFSWDGTSFPAGFTYDHTDLYFNPDGVCPM